MSYLETNLAAWNARTDVHLTSRFYDVPGFLAGKNMLMDIERGLLGDLTGKSVLHLQCHFGLDTLSLARLGATVTGMDLSDRAIDEARKLADQAGIPATFVCCDLYSLPQHLEGQFDVVFTSYGTIGWLPDLERWAAVVEHFLKPGGTFLIVEFHPIIWMFDSAFTKIEYPYLNSGPIVEEEGTYTDGAEGLKVTTTSWNHGLTEVITPLLQKGLIVREFREYDYSPYACFTAAVEQEPGKFRVPHLGKSLPMVYALKMEKTA